MYRFETFATFLRLGLEDQERVNQARLFKRPVNEPRLALSLIKFCDVLLYSVILSQPEETIWLSLLDALRAQVFGFIVFQPFIVECYNKQIFFFLVSAAVSLVLGGLNRQNLLDNRSSGLHWHSFFCTPWSEAFSPTTGSLDAGSSSGSHR